MTNSNGESSQAVIITGGGTGIGQSTAHAFADRGGQVLVVGRTQSTLDETAAGRPGIRTLAVDITQHDAPKRIVDAALSAFGRIDVLVNNAGVASGGALDDIYRDQVEAQFATNLSAPIFLTQCALEALAESCGVIVNISTAGSLGRRAWPGMSIYGASKVGLDFLTRTWAVELAPRKIRVVGIAPGVIDTGMGLRMGWSVEQNEQFLEQMRGHIPIGRVGTAEEIAWWTVQLTCPQAGYGTGFVLAVDGAASNV